MKFWKTGLVLFGASALAGAAYGFWSSSRFGARPTPLQAFVQNAGFPAYVRTEYLKFREALVWAEKEGRARHLKLEWRALPVSLEAKGKPTLDLVPDEIKGLPWEIREVFANPTITWGREPLTNRWDAVVAFKVVGKEEWVLGAITDALGTPKLLMSNIRNDAPDFVLAGAYLSTLAEAWQTFHDSPLEDVIWGVPESDYLVSLRFDPHLGLAQSVEGIEGEDEDEMGESHFLPRKTLTVAKVLGEPNGQVFFRSGDHLYACQKEQWSAWKDPARPDLKKPSGP